MTERPADPNDRDAKTFDALDAYVADGQRVDESLNPLFACLDRLADLSPTQLPNHNRPSQDDCDSSSQIIGLPQQLGDYRLGVCLGRGGMGTVYRAEHVTMGHAVAIKVIPGDDAAPREVVDRFYQEARAAAGEEHPNVVAVRHIGQEAGLHFLVMDLVVGQTLADRLLDGPIPWRDAVALVARVADALKHLHERGVVHRDLKPSNILLDEQGRPYVTDFGLAKLAGAVVKTQSRALVGTPRYMSPEQAMGKAREVGPESDVFSLGTVLYECLTGRPAFDAEHPLDAVLQVIESEPPPVRRLEKTVARDVQTVVNRCMEKDRSARYRSAGEVFEDLSACLTGEPLARSRSDAAASAKRVFRRRPALFLRLIGIGAIALVVQASYWIGLIKSAPGSVSPDPVGHVAVMSALGGWLIGTVLLQFIWMRAGSRTWVPYLWSLTDTGFLSLTLLISDAPLDAPTIGYPCLIAVAGVWLRPKVVWATGLAATIGYLLLLGAHNSAQPHYPIIFIAGLSLVALATVHQVQRVRWLTAVAETPSINSTL